ncbi:MAG: aminopeptidase [Planctomycetota bacterium]
MIDSWLDRLANTIARYSLSIQPGDVTVISGEPASQPLLVKLFQTLVIVGARPLIRLSSDICLNSRVSSLADGVHRYINPLQIDDGTPIQWSVGIWTCDYLKQFSEKSSSTDMEEPVGVPSTFSVDELSQLNSRRFITIFPTLATADALGISLERLQDLLIKSAYLDHLQPERAWRTLHAQQLRLCEYLVRSKELRVVTENGTDLTVNIQDRPWISGDGHANLPDGEVYVSPWETSAHGTLVVDAPLIYRSDWIRGLRLRFLHGKVVDATAQEGEKALHHLLATDPGASVIGEFGLGTNPRRSTITGITLLDEKIAGTAHVALGAAPPATQGTNRSSIHRDLLVDPRRTGRIEVDGKPLLLSQQSSLWRNV